MTRAPLTDDLRRRVTAAQRLLREARSSLDAAGLFAAGLAVLRLRDAATLLLAAAADHLGVGVGPARPTSLAGLAEAVSAASEAPLTHREALRRLARAADAFVSTAGQPEPDDAGRLLHDLESFFTETVRSVLGADPSRLGLRRLLGHRRTENWLAAAEAALDDGEPAEAVRAAAAAFAIYRHHLEGEDDRAGGGDAGGGADDSLAALRRDLAEQRRRLDLVMDGVDLAGYRRFQRLAPPVEIDADRSLHFGEGDAPDPSADDAAFCHAFVLDTLLALRDRHPAPASPGGLTNVVLRVTRETPILVAPTPDAEEVRRVTGGEVLKTHRGGEPENGHLQIVVDGDPAWVAAGAVEEIG